MRDPPEARLGIENRGVCSKSPQDRGLAGAFIVHRALLRQLRNVLMKNVLLTSQLVES